jgi:hypothetical protein
MHLIPAKARSWETSFVVMAGLVPAIHVFVGALKGVDAWHKAGHDDTGTSRAS